MTRLNSARLARDLGALFATGTLANLTDAQLLDQFIAHRDERCFEELIARHGPMVLAICRRSLDDPLDIEDAFQAIFLILVRKARSLRDRNALSSWLHGVAFRVVRRARKNAYRRHLRERPISAEPATRTDPRNESTGNEVFAIVDQEIRRLPRKQQVAVILCLLEGCTHEAAATKLGCPLGTVKSRIASARQTLTRRLTRRGLTPSGIAGILGPGLTLTESARPISPYLVRMATKAAVRSLAKPSILTVALSAPVAKLVQEVLRIAVLPRIPAVALLAMTLIPMALMAPVLSSALPEGPAPRVSQRAQPSATLPAAPLRPPKTDLYGDPLPPGAAMRLGTVRFRQDRSINHIAYSPDGRVLVTDDSGRFFQLWDPKTGKKLRQIDSGLERVRYFDFSPDGRTIAAVGTHYSEGHIAVQRLTLTDFPTGRLVRRGEWSDPARVRRVHYAPDGKTLATANESAGFQLWDLATLKIVYREGPKAGHNVSLAFSPDASSHLLAIARGQTIRFWDTEHRRDVRTIAMDEEHHATDITFSPDGTTVATNTNLGRQNVHEFWLWKVGDGTLLGRFASAEDPLSYAMSFSPDGKVLAAIGDEDQLISFDVATFKRLDVLPAVRAAASPLVFSPDGGTLTTIAGEQTLHFWDRATGQDRLATPDAHQDMVSTLEFLDGGKTVVSRGRDQTIRFWDLATGRQTTRFGGPATNRSSSALMPDGSLSSIASRADGTRLAAGIATSRRKVQVWNLDTGAPVQAWSIDKAEPNTSFRGIMLSRDASAATAVLNDGSLRSWDLAIGNVRPIAQPKLARDPDHDPDDIDQSLFSHDGRSLVLGYGEGSIKVFDVSSGELRFETSAAIRDADFKDYVRSRPSMSFAPDSQSLAFVRQVYKQIKLADGQSRSDWPRESTIVLLDSRTGYTRREIVIPEPNVGDLTFSPDGRRIAASTSSAEGRSAIRIFRTRDKKEIQTIETQRVAALSFTPDGSRIAAGLYDTSIVLWDVPRGD
jgi:RNA polymerase sigma factor (sigma-70 family)